MRTTVTLEPDLETRLRGLAQERGTSLKDTINATIRAGLEAGSVTAERYEEQTVDLRVRPGVDLTKALQLASEMEDEAILHKLELRK
jgi:hypothetical protein